VSLLILFIKRLLSGIYVPPVPATPTEFLTVLARSETLSVGQRLETLFVLARSETLSVGQRLETLTVAARSETLTVEARD
jgi:hypothetical protein